MGKTLERPELDYSEKVDIINHFILTMIAQRHCPEYIAECLTLLVPGLDPEAIMARTEEIIK